MIIVKNLRKFEIGIKFFLRSSGTFISKMGAALGSKRREYTIGSGSKTGNRASPPPEENSYVEKIVCQKDEIENGSMAEFEMGEHGKILLVKENGVFSAVGTKCTHYGAPLKNGVLINGKVRCPWHGACFNSKTGDIEDFPGLDSLPCFDVKVEEDGSVKVKASVSALKSAKRMKPMVKYSCMNTSTYVIVGGGAAGEMCSETLRQEGFTGKIILVTQEKNLPYDRPKLSKALESKAVDLYLRKEDFFKKYDISVMLDTKVTSLDTKEKQVICNNGNLKIKYDSLMIATGGTPIHLDIPGTGLKNIFYLRTPEDGQAIAKVASGKTAVIVGSSFIGMEVAAYLTGKASSIHVIGRSPVPFTNVFGHEIGQRILALHQENGIVFHAGTNVTKFIGNEKLESVELSSGEIITADLCIVGIGVKPSTDFLKDSGIDLNQKGLVVVDETLQTNLQDVYAAGDIVEFPLTTYDNTRVNISHWQIASSHGRTAALNMLGRKSIFHSVPFFWSMMYGKSFRYAGYAPSFDEVLIKGDMDKLQFVAYFVKGSKVLALCSVNSDPEAARFASQVLQGEQLLKHQVQVQ